MIDSYKILSKKYLKKNKKRTILTIIGIILSVALISCIGIFILNIRYSMIEQAKNRYGDYHVVILDAKKNDINKLRFNPKVETCGLIEGVDQKREELYSIGDKEISIVRGDSESFKLFKVNFLDGTFPSSEGEIALEKWVLKAFGKDTKLGSKVVIKNEKGVDEFFTIKGIIENQEYSQINGRIKAFTYIKTSTENTKIMVKFRDNVDKKKFIKELRDVYGNDNIRLNENLLAVTGNSSSGTINNAITIVASMVIAIIIIATIFVIYNAFNISIAERMKDLGLLRAVGTTQKQMRKLVIREARIMSIIAIPIGLVCGVVAIYTVIFIFSKMPGATEFAKIKLIIDWRVLAVSFIIGFIAVYISAFLPSLAAGKVSPLVAINNDNLLTKEKNKRRKKWLSKVIKVYKVLAIKNVRRNKKRFYISTISMTISVTLFITFASFINMTEKLMNQENEDKNYHFEIKSIDNSKDLSTDVINQVKNMDGILEITNNYSDLYINALVQDNKIPERFKNSQYNINTVKLNGKDIKQMNAIVEFYDKNKMQTTKSYIKQGNIDGLKEGEVILVRNNTFYDKNGILNKTPIEEFNIGEYININFEPLYLDKLKTESNKVDFGDKDIKKLKVRAITDTLPFGDNMNIDSILILARLEDKDKMLGKKLANEKIKLQGISIVLKDTSFEKQVDEKLSDITASNSKIRYANKLQETKANESFSLQIKILLMGFITVITLISSLNIVNTVSTNIILRRRELASLKAIGMTSRELKKMITLEGMLFGIYGGIIGSILGGIFSYLLYKQMNRMVVFNYSIPVKYIVIAMISVILIGYISALIPLRRLKNDNIIETIKDI
ncbi:putative ABC transport system permease protein [Clostridium cavendishii DSM 21758]|uniref:Putative ABC transport system permease protein n=1 Tax=Clostridium cavendishii DSM 21758 TaxID=1121302 RepID=A0A1M6J3L7_9CLOT|nr:FtsX-like permease family protein [Clostridium cavendishii]SHJ41286.1 putative ABC transport system permease protein [Clostridium cavendishii DSM 21758]